MLTPRPPESVRRWFWLATSGLPSRVRVNLSLSPEGCFRLKLCKTLWGKAALLLLPINRERVWDSSHLAQTPRGASTEWGWGCGVGGSTQSCPPRQMQCRQWQDVFLNFRVFPLTPSEALGGGCFARAGGDETGEQDYIDDDLMRIRWGANVLCTLGSVKAGPSYRII